MKRKLIYLLVALATLTGFFPAAVPASARPTVLASATQSVPLTATGTWAAKTAMPAARAWPVAGSINGTLYVAGGGDGTVTTTTLQAYNPVTDNWSTLAPMPARRNASDGASVIGGKLYVTGGWNTPDSALPQNSLFVYDPVSNNWTTKAGIPQTGTLYGSAGGASGAINDKLYVTTPESGYSGYFNYLHVYDPATNSWTQLTSSPVAHDRPAYGVINGKLYVAGGATAGGALGSQLDVYDPVTDNWSTKASMPAVGSGFGSATIYGKLYAISGNPASGTVYVYDPMANSWSTETSIPTPRGGPAVGVIKGVAYVAGGNNGTNPIANLEAFTAPLPFLTFVSDRDGNLEIYMMSSNGDNQTRLTSNADYDNFPVLSPDGSKIVFTSSRDGNREIYSMSANGSGQTRLTNNNSPDIWPVWSPDGTRIVFQAGRDGSRQIYVMSANGDNQTRLTSSPAGGTYPGWSPDGRKIVFTSNGGADWGDIYVMDAAGDNVSLQQLTTNPAFDDLPAWSPDGARIAFTSGRDGHGEIYVMNANGDNQTRLTNSPSGESFQPVWSPDGSRIAFTSTRDGNAEIYRMDANGENVSLQRSTNNSAGDWARAKWIGPTVSTDNATVTGTTSATLNGSLSALGSTGNVSVSFDWGLTGGNYTGSTAAAPLTATGPFNFALTGLSANTTYHFRSVARGDGHNFGIDRTFRTLVVPTSNFTLSTMSDNVTVVRGQTAIIPIKVGFLAGYTSSGVNFQASTNVSLAAFFTPTPIMTPGGVVLKIDTTNMTAGAYALTIQGTDNSSSAAAPPFTLRVVTTSDIRFYEFDANYARTYITTKNVTKQSSLSVFTEGTDSDGRPLTGPLTLQSSNPNVLGVYPGNMASFYVYALQAGNATLTATAPDGFSRALTVTVTVPGDPAITSISLTPAQVTNKYTGNLTFAATGTRSLSWYILGMLSDNLKDSTMDWSNSNMTYGGNFKINDANPPGLGTYIFGVTIPGANQTVLAEAAKPMTIVNDPSYSGIRGGVVTLDPSLMPWQTEMYTLEFWQGGTRQFTRMVFQQAMLGTPGFDMGAITPGTYQIKYIPGNSGIKSQWYPNADNATGAANVVFQAGQVTSNIYFFATSGPVLNTITVTPSNRSIPAGTMQQYGATGSYSDGSTANITPMVSWSSNSTSVATVNASGLATAVAPGTTSITASLGIVTGSTLLTVTPVSPLSVTTNDASSVTGNSAVLNGFLNSLGGVPSANVSFQWGLSTNYTSETPPQPMNFPGAFSAQITGLSSNNTYHFRAKATSNVTAFAGDRILTWTQPDLAIVEKHEVWVQTGVSYIVGYTVKNTGNATAPPGHRAALMVNNNIIETKPVPVSLAPSANYTDNFTTVVNLSGGGIDHVSVFADIYGEVPDPNPGNNQVVNTIAWPPAPDLAVHKSERWVQEGSQYMVDYTMRNMGNAAAPAGHSTALMIDGITVQTQPVNIILNPGQVYNGTFATSNLSGGVDKIFVTVDANNQVAESDENNNSWDNTLAWPPAPDLTIKMKWEEWAQGSNSQYQVFARMFNTGNGPAAAGHHVEIRADGVVMGIITVPVVMNPEAVFQVISGNITLTGISDNITVTADINNEVAESDETNNSRWNIWPPQGPPSTGPLAVTTGNVTGVTGSSAILNGALNSLGSAPSANVSFQWGVSTNYTGETPPQPMSFPGAFSANLTGLSGNATYHFRAKATSNVTAFGNDMSFFTVAGPAGVMVSINASSRVSPGNDFIALVNIGQVQNFDAANFDVSFNATVIRLDNVTSGNVGNVSVPVDFWNQREPGRFTIAVNVPGLTGINGTGSLAVLHFHVIGSLGQSSNITLSSGVLSNNLAQEIPAIWMGGSVMVSLLPGDADGNGVINALDVTKIERIIGHYDQMTPGADANLDNNVNALDITKTERLIVGLDQN